MDKAKRKNNEPRPRPVWKTLVTPFGQIIKFSFSLLATITNGSIRATWWLTQMSGRGIVWSIRQLWYATLWLLVSPWFVLRFLINGRIPNFENARQEEIFWRIKRQYRRKRVLLLHGMGYALGLLFFASFIFYEIYVYLSAIRESRWDGSLVVGAMMAVWTVILLFHFFLARVGHAEDEALGVALEREYERSERNQDYAEHHERLIEPTDDNPYDYEEKAKHNHRFS